jgi:hypothetical protein
MRIRTLFLVGMILAAGAASGCYRKVVGARGPGADTTRIEQPNVPSPEGRSLGYPKYQHRSMPGG